MLTSLLCIALSFAFPFAPSVIACVELLFCFLINVLCFDLSHSPTTTPNSLDPLDLLPTPPTTTTATTTTTTSLTSPTTSTVARHRRASTIATAASSPSLTSTATNSPNSIATITTSTSSQPFRHHPGVTGTLLREMVSRRKILSRSRDDLNLEQQYQQQQQEDEDDVWYHKEKLYKVSEGTDP